MTTTHICQQMDWTDKIELHNGQWIFEYQNYETAISEDESIGIDEFFTEHRLVINFCLFCGEKLNPNCDSPTIKHHKNNIPSDRRNPGNFCECPPQQDYNDANPDELWLVTKPFFSAFQLEKYNIEGEDGLLKFHFDIVYCPFCGEPLNMRDAYNLPRDGWFE